MSAKEDKLEKVRRILQWLLEGVDRELLQHFVEEELDLTVDELYDFVEKIN